MYVGRARPVPWPVGGGCESALAEDRLACGGSLRSLPSQRRHWIDPASRSGRSAGVQRTIARPSVRPPAERKSTPAHASTASPCMAVEAIGLDPKWIPSVIEHVAVKESKPDSEALRLYVGARLLAAAGKDGAAALAKALGHKSRTVRLAAAQAIQKIGKQAKTAAVVKALNAALANDATRIDAAAALVAIGASAKAAVPGLIKDLESGQINMLRSLDYRYACRAADVLALIPEAVPALIEGLGSDKEIVRIGCIWAMVTATKVTASGDKVRIPFHPIYLTRAVLAAAKAMTKKPAD